MNPRPRLPELMMAVIVVLAMAYTANPSWFNYRMLRAREWTRYLREAIAYNWRHRGRARV